MLHITHVSAPLGVVLFSAGFTGPSYPTTGLAD
jgi:hypothetical protein